MAKVKFFNKKIISDFKENVASISLFLSLMLIFVSIPNEIKIYCGAFFLTILVIIYTYSWNKANKMKSIDIRIEESIVTIKSGDIFKEDGFKVIAFNEYFDTLVNDQIISEGSINGIFLKKKINESIESFDSFIDNKDLYDDEDFLCVNNERKLGKKQKYKIGTIAVYKKEYIITAFTKFDKNNKAYLTMPDYLGFLITLWDKINNVYAQKSVVVPIFGSGITRIKEHKNISDEELLKIMLWTFRISEMRFKYPAKLTIIIHDDKIDKINLLDISSSGSGL
ncbi:macro domain-containing protein (plasmid) [Morganella morganii]